MLFCFGLGAIFDELIVKLMETYFFQLVNRIK